MTKKKFQGAGRERCDICIFIQSKILTSGAFCVFSTAGVPVTVESPLFLDQYDARIHTGFTLIKHISVRFHLVLGSVGFRKTNSFENLFVPASNSVSLSPVSLPLSLALCVSLSLWWISQMAGMMHASETDYMRAAHELSVTVSPDPSASPVVSFSPAALKTCEGP